MVLPLQSEYLGPGGRRGTTVVAVIHGKRTCGLVRDRGSGGPEVDLISLLSKANDVSRPGVRDVLPVASLVLLVGGLIFAGAPGPPRINKVLLAAQHLSVIGFGLLVLTIGAMSIFLQPVISGITGLLQDKAHWRPMRLISYRVSRRKRKRRDMTQRTIEGLYQLAAERALTAPGQAQFADRAHTPNESELGEIEELSDRLRRYPAHGRVRATTLGNVLAAAEEDAGRPYGLDSRVALPRLEPLLPESAAKELDAKRDDLMFAARFCATLVLATLVSALLLATGRNLAPGTCICCFVCCSVLHECCRCRCRLR